jgi:hypothetical protein
VVYATQANITSGPQLVNSGMGAASHTQGNEFSQPGNQQAPMSHYRTP